MLPEIRGTIARIEVRDGVRVLSRGTGFLVTDRLVLTAFHVVGDRTQRVLYEQQYGLFLCFPGLECPGRTVEGAWDAGADWAVAGSAFFNSDDRPAFAGSVHNAIIGVQ